MKYSDILNSYMTLKDIANSGQAMSGKISIAMARNLQKMEPIVQVISQEEMKNADEFGSKDENGSAINSQGQINFESPEKRKLFLDSMSTVYEMEEDIEFIKVSDDDISSINLTINQAINLTFMIE